LTLNPETTVDGHGNKLHFVPGVLEDLKEQGGELQLSLVQLEQAILEVASQQPDSTPLKYLLGCWKRVVRQLRGISSKGGASEDPRYHVLKEAKRICMSYCVFAATMPEMFGCVTRSKFWRFELLMMNQTRAYDRKSAYFTSAVRS
jgi:ubiquitin conjugation factor E4 B